MPNNGAVRQRDHVRSSCVGGAPGGAGPPEGVPASTAEARQAQFSPGPGFTRRRRISLGCRPGQPPGRTRKRVASGRSPGPLASMPTCSTGGVEADDTSRVHLGCWPGAAEKHLEAAASRTRGLRSRVKLRRRGPAPAHFRPLMTFSGALAGSSQRSMCPSTSIPVSRPGLPAHRQPEASPAGKRRRRPPSPDDEVIAADAEETRSKRYA